MQDCRQQRMEKKKKKRRHSNPSSQDHQASAQLLRHNSGQVWGLIFAERVKIFSRMLPLNFTSAKSFAFFKTLKHFRSDAQSTPASRAKNRTIYSIAASSLARSNIQVIHHWAKHPRSFIEKQHKYLFKGCMSEKLHKEA